MLVGGDAGEVHQSGNDDYSNFSDRARITVQRNEKLRVWGFVTHEKNDWFFFSPILTMLLQQTAT